MQANNCVEAIWRGNLKNCRGRIICFATVSIWYRGSSINLVSVIVLVRVGFLFITEQKKNFFSALLLIYLNRIHSDRSFHCDVCNVCLDKRLEGKHKCRPDSGHDECCICLEVKSLCLWREQTYSWSHVLKRFFVMRYVFIYFLFIFFLYNFFLLLKEIVIL